MVPSAIDRRNRRSHVPREGATAEQAGDRIKVVRRERRRGRASADDWLPILAGGEAPCGGPFGGRDRGARGAYLPHGQLQAIMNALLYNGNLEPWLQQRNESGEHKVSLRCVSNSIRLLPPSFVSLTQNDGQIEQVPFHVSNINCNML